MRSFYFKINIVYKKYNLMLFINKKNINEMNNNH